MIGSSILNCAVYVYPSVNAARDGVSVGGSGFIVGIPAPVADWWHLYVVTNKHVVDRGNHVLRINTKDGAFDTIESEPGAWTVSLDDDVAVLPFDCGQHLEFDFIPVSLFLPEAPDQSNKMFSFEVGDDAVLIGRLVTHEGRQKNKPIARFGSISMLPDPEEPITISGDRTQVAFLVDCRSLSGASGSAVLGYRLPHRDGWMMLGQGGPVLLGIDCAHMPFWTPVCNAKDRSSAQEDAWVESNSGIAVVVPAWRILALLNTDQLERQRREEDEEISRMNHPTS